MDGVAVLGRAPVEATGLAHGDDAEDDARAADVAHQPRPAVPLARQDGWRAGLAGLADLEGAGGVGRAAGGDEAAGRPGLAQRRPQEVPLVAPVAHGARCMQSAPLRKG